MIHSVSFEATNDEGANIYHLKGVYDHKPKTLNESSLRFFQRLEIIEKTAEIADESFHLLGSLLQKCCSLEIYQTIRGLHHSSHEIEYILHSFCFFGDICRMINGNFLEYSDHHSKLDVLISCARISHAASHFFKTISLLHELKILPFKSLHQALRYSQLFSILGFGLWTISLLWYRRQKMIDEHFSSDLSIQLSGFLFVAIPFTKNFEATGSYVFIINKLAAAAGLIHAWSCLQRLLPRDQEEVEAHFVIEDHSFSDHEDHIHDQS